MLFTEKGSVAQFGKWRLLICSIDDNKLIYKHLPRMAALPNPANADLDLFQDIISHILKDNMKGIRDFKGNCKFSTYL